MMLGQAVRTVLVMGLLSASQGMYAISDGVMQVPVHAMLRMTRWFAFR